MNVHFTSDSDIFYTYLDWCCYKLLLDRSDGAMYADFFFIEFLLLVKLEELTHMNGNGWVTSFLKKSLV